MKTRSFSLFFILHPSAFIHTFVTRLRGARWVCDDPALESWAPSRPFEPVFAGGL